MTARYSAAARRDRREAEAYYARSPRALAMFRQELLRALEFVREYPDGAPVRERDVRAKRLLHFPYTILYRIVDESVFVLAIACQLRDPDTYDDRLN